MRQRSDRYKIRAGRNLPDKEFRYLRTVIVTADIHGDLGSEPRLAAQRPITFQGSVHADLPTQTPYEFRPPHPDDG